MTNDDFSQNRFYQRGLVLGFTMAEVFVLIIFALLLLLTVMFDFKHKELLALQEQLEAQKREATRLTAMLQSSEQKALELGGETAEAHRKILALTGRRISAKTLSVKANAFDDLFFELVPREEWDSIPTGPEGRAAALKQAVGGIKESAEKWDAASAAINDAGGGQRLSDSESWMESLAAGLGRVIRQGSHAGTGTENPSCWVNPKTGKPQYIFDVTLTDSGLIVQDNALPERVMAQQDLPIKDIVFDRELTPERFLALTEPLFSLCEQQGCKFFVRVRDRTGPASKTIYKSRLRTVGRRFYYYEVVRD